jgi:NDP-sugar pyrophosphorylase family protein
MLPVAILAGGLAKRLRPITETIPKALVDVAGEPFILHQLRFLRAQGVQKVVLCVGYLGEMIQALVGDGVRLGLDVTYSHDGLVLLGTGGALRKAQPMLGKHFFVLYGDSFLPLDFAPVEKAFFISGKLALMTVLKNGDRWDKSNVNFADGELLEYNKNDPKPSMNYIDYGLGVIDSRILQDEGLAGVFDLATLYSKLSLQGQLAGYEVQKRFYEIGSHIGLQDTELYFLKKDKI